MVKEKIVILFGAKSLLAKVYGLILGFLFSHNVTNPVFLFDEELSAKVVVFINFSLDIRAVVEMIRKIADDENVENILFISDERLLTTINMFFIDRVGKRKVIYLQEELVGFKLEELENKQVFLRQLQKTLSYVGFVPEIDLLVDSVFSLFSLKNVDEDKLIEDFKELLISIRPLTDKNLINFAGAVERFVLKTTKEYVNVPVEPEAEILVEDDSEQVSECKEEEKKIEEVKEIKSKKKRKKFRKK